MQLPSKHLDKAVEAISSLPGIGGRTALRLALFLLKQPQDFALDFGDAIHNLVKNAKRCVVCNNISDHDTCSICASVKRDKKTICVVEDIRDVMAIEGTQQYFGSYHVLGGLISPMDGIGPADLAIGLLATRLNSGEVEEVIFALSATMEGDTTNFYLYRQFKEIEIKLTTIARGVAVGNELEYTDEITLGKSIRNRLLYESSLTH